MPFRFRMIAVLSAALLCSGDGRRTARAESDWLGQQFQDKTSSSERRRSSPPLSKPVKSPSQARQAKQDAEDAAEQKRAKEQAQRQAELKAEKRAEAERLAAKTKLEARARESRSKADAEANLRLPETIAVPKLEPPGKPANAVTDASAPSDAAAPAAMRLGVAPPSIVAPADHRREGATAAPRTPVVNVRPSSPPVPALHMSPPAVDETSTEASAKPAEPMPPLPAARSAQAIVLQAEPHPAQEAKPVPIGFATPAPSSVTPDGSGLTDARATATLRGQHLWLHQRGGRHASMEGCDLGLGPGRVVGTFAHLPRYFADAHRVMDLETRLLWCAQTLQDIDTAQMLRQRTADGQSASELDDLVTYVASLAISWRLAAPQTHVAERQAVTVGAALYTRRQGPLDFACASCHGHPTPDATGAATRTEVAQINTRRRTMHAWQGRPVPQLTLPSDSQTLIASWPLWRADTPTQPSRTHEPARTLQSQLAACFQMMNIDPPARGSDTMIALVSYLTRLAEKGEVVSGRRMP